MSEEFWETIEADIHQTHIIVNAKAGHGKALTLDTPIPTIEGWKELKDLTIEDMIFDESGNVCKIIKISPVMYNHDVYEIGFDDGAKIKADKDHLWYTSTRNSRLGGWRAKKQGDYNKKAFYSIKTTENIKRTLRVQEKRAANHAIDVTKPLKLCEKSLPIPPYTLGAWLGDGTSESGSITISDEEIIERIKKDGFILSKNKAKYRYTIRKLQPKLRENNLLKNKHIPAIYFRSSIEQRIELLRGLMDTDGTCSKDHNSSICVTKEILAKDISELIHTLGIKHRFIVHDAKIYGRIVSKRYRIRFCTPLNLFYVKRKSDRVPQKTRSTREKRYITKIKKIPTEPVKCIQVDSPNNLFLVGKQLIPTHNSTFVKSIIHGLKERDPRLIIKTFDVSYAWWDNAPLKNRQHVTVENWANAFNQDDCVYEMGDLTEETRRLFVSLIVKQDYMIRRKIREVYGEGGLKKMPFIIYVFEESDTYFDSASLNKKDDASATLRDFIKVGRNFGLRAFCIVTANTGELGTKLRRRSNHLIGRIISESDLREYNRNHKGMGNTALALKRFQWIYYNGEKMIGPISIEPIIFGVPDTKPVDPKAVVEMKIKLEDAPKSIPRSEGGNFMQIVFWLMVIALVLSFLFFR